MPAGGLRACLMLSPSLGLFVALFIAPFAYFFVVSFWQFRSYRLVRDPTVANYAEVLRDYVPLMVFTLGMSTLIAACALSAGFVYAYIIRFRSGRFGPLLLFAALITLFGGYLMKIYAWRTILGTEGIVNSLLLHLGIVAEPLTWLLYNPPAVVL